MGYLFFQTWLWILAAGLLGLFIGWLIWGRRGDGGSSDSNLRTELDQCRSRCKELEGKLASAKPGSDVSDSNKVKVQKPVSESSADAAVAVKDEWKPLALDGPQNGKADDLKRIKGIGPVIEKTLNGLGVYHFAQIGDFTNDNITWVDNYIAFPGRIRREEWVKQALQLAEGGDTEFSGRYDRGETNR